MPDKKGSLFGAVNDLKNVEADEEDADEKERAKFNENTLAGRIARTKTFEWSTLGVIVFNALYLGYDCDYNARWGKPDDLYKSSLWAFMMFDNLFCLFFTGELVIRFVGYKIKMDCLNKPFFFDLALVSMMVLETWVLAFLGPIDALKQVSILRLLRLTRLFRMAKLMRYFPELQLIVKGMVAAVRSVGCAAILLVLVLYVFAIIFTNEYHQGLIADDDPDIPEIAMLFGSLGKSMRHLLIMATILDDITACCNAIRSTDNIMMLMAFMVCVLISSFTLFNMLLGILCEVVEATEEGEKNKDEQSRLSETIMGFFRAMDLDNNGSICRSEFLKMSQDSTVMSALEKLSIDQKQFEKYAELLFTPKEEGLPIPTLQYKDATAMIMRLRPGQSVNACDFEYFKATIMAGNQLIDRHLTGLEKLVEEAGGVDPDDIEEEDTTAISPFNQFDDDASPASNSFSNSRRPSKGSNDPKMVAVMNNSYNTNTSRQSGAPTNSNNRSTVGNGGGGGKSRPASNFRAPPTIKTLARDRRSGAATVPPVGPSRWSMSEQSPPQSPASPMRRGGTNEEVVAERLLQLAEKRRTLSTNLRASMGQMQPNAMQPIPNYHMTQYSNNFRTTMHTNATPYPNEAVEDNRPPFSPQQFNFN